MLSYIPYLRGIGLSGTASGGWGALSVLGSLVVASH